MHRILSVDDEPINQIIVEELFSDHYDVCLAASGEECLKTVEEIQPQLILLDVSMAGMDGYTTSLMLKERRKTKNIPIIFVSARSTLEDKIKGYEAGGHDYITKPFDHNELSIKINQLINTSALNTDHHSQNQAENASISSNIIDSHTDIIQVDEFFNELVQCNSIADAAELVLDFCKSFSLSCTLQLRTDDTTLNRSCFTLVTPLESSLFEGALNKNRFFDFGTHTIISYPHISLLIKNMPTQAPDQRENIKHWLSILMAGTDSRIAAINNSDLLQSRYKLASDAIRQNLQEFDFHDNKIKKHYEHKVWLD